MINIASKYNNPKSIIGASRLSFFFATKTCWSKVLLRELQDFHLAIYMMKSSLLNTNNGVVFAPCCCDSGAKFSGVPNCGKYRKVLEGAITEVIIHRKCTNSTSPLFSETFWKHFSTNFSFVIYATNKHFLFTLSFKSLRFRKNRIWQRWIIQPNFSRLKEGKQDEGGNRWK